MKTNKFKSMIKRLFESVAETTKRFPYALVFAALAAGVMIFYVHLENSLTIVQNEWLQRIAMVLFLGIPLALSLKMLIELINHLENKKSIFVSLCLRLAGLALLVLYLFFGLPEFESTYIIRYVGFILFLWSMFIVIPFLKGRDLIEIYTFKIGWRLLVTAFYCGIIYGGLSGILFSLKELLDVPIISEHYQDLLFIVAGVILPSFFFVGIPKKEDTTPESHTKFFRILLIYVVMPILTAYTVVLYLYFIRMIIEQLLPKNIIGNLVLWYSLAGILILYLSKTESLKSKWAKFFDTWFARLLFVPLGMMFTAIILRVNQYGITEPRYFTIIGGCWALAMALYIVFKKSETRKNVVIPLTAALLAFLTVIGPWSAFSISKISQNTRLENILNRNEMIVENMLVEYPAISDDDQSQISSIILYFDKNHDLSDIKSFKNYDSIEDIEKDIGFELSEWREQSYNYVYYRLKSDEYIFELDDYDYMFFARENNSVIDSAIGEISVENDYDNDKESQEIIVKLNGKEVFRKNTLDYGEQLFSDYPNQEELTKEQLSFVHDLGELKIKIIFFHLEFNINEDEDDNMERGGWADFIVLIDLEG